VSARRRLPNRRRSETIEFERDGSTFRITVGYFPNNEVGEVFVNGDRANSTLDALVSDSAIAVSLALQHGASLQEIAHALKRDSHGRATSPIGAALDRIAP
jgi:uncharacterized protein YkuJ